MELEGKGILTSLTSKTTPLSTLILLSDGSKVRLPNDVTVPSKFLLAVYIEPFEATSMKSVNNDFSLTVNLAIVPLAVDIVRTLLGSTTILNDKAGKLLEVPELPLNKVNKSCPVVNDKLLTISLLLKRLADKLKALTLPRLISIIILYPFALSNVTESSTFKLIVN